MFLTIALLTSLSFFIPLIYVNQESFQTFFVTLSHQIHHYLPSYFDKPSDAPVTPRLPETLPGKVAPQNYTIQVPFLGLLSEGGSKIVATIGSSLPKVAEEPETLSEKAYYYAHTYALLFKDNLKDFKDSLFYNSIVYPLYQRGCDWYETLGDLVDEHYISASDEKKEQVEKVTILIGAILLLLLLFPWIKRLIKYAIKDAKQFHEGNEKRKAFIKNSGPDIVIEPKVEPVSKDTPKKKKGKKTNKNNGKGRKIAAEIEEDETVATATMLKELFTASQVNARTKLEYKKLAEKIREQSFPTTKLGFYDSESDGGSEFSMSDIGELSVSSYNDSDFYEKTVTAARTDLSSYLQAETKFTTVVTSTTREPVERPETPVHGSTEMALISSQSLRKSKSQRFEGSPSRYIFAKVPREEQIYSNIVLAANSRAF